MIRSRPDFIHVREQDRKRVRRVRLRVPCHHNTDHRTIFNNKKRTIFVTSETVVERGWGRRPIHSLFHSFRTRGPSGFGR